MLTGSWALRAIAVLGWTLCAGSLAAQKAPTYRASAEIVRLQVAVFDEDGVPVTDLGRSDFTVLADGEERPLSVFAPPTDEPVEVAVLMDVSGSMSFWDSRPLYEVLLDGLPPGSCVLLIPFDERVYPGLWGRPDAPWVRAVVQHSQQDGLAEALYDALLVAFSRLRERAAGGSVDFTELLRYRSPRLGPSRVARPGGSCRLPDRTDSHAPPRRAVLLLTDQVDSASRSRLPDAILASWGSGIPIFALAVIREEGRGNVPMGRLRRSLRRRTEAIERRYLDALETLSRHTGGVIVEGVRERRSPDRWFRPRGGAFGVTEAAERLVRALRGHYVLGFVPSRDGAGDSSLLVETEIEVRVTGEDLDVLTSGAVARGVGKSDGRALQLSLRGFEHLAAERVREALSEFDAAISVGPELGAAHFGRALALGLASRPDESLTSFARARRFAPWLPDLDARIAAAYLEIGDLDAAWEHALRAHFRGSDVSRVLDELMALAPRDAELDRPPENPRVAVRAGVPNGIGQTWAADRLVAIVWNLAAGSEVMHGGWAPQSSDLLLRIEMRHSEATRSRVTIRGRLILLDRDGEELTSQPFTAGNMFDLEATATDLKLPFRSIEAAIRSFHSRRE